MKIETVDEKGGNKHNKPGYLSLLLAYKIDLQTKNCSTKTIKKKQFIVCANSDYYT